MWIKRVVARSFGPFRGDALELAPGMTVVSGPNEAGKSTWHAAIRLAITGVRRGKGPGSAAERLQAERHRPWDAAEHWEVEARLALDDGREIDISQDLAGKVKCRAMDVNLGRDVSDEIMDGTPDASRWLGLTRDAFAATVSVNQAQILAVAEAADELQEFMQRAAATQGTDATAAMAIDRLEQFRRDAVGADTVAAKGPLRTARNRLAAAEAAHAEAQRLHAEYLERSAAMDGAHQGVAKAEARLAAVEAALAAHDAAEADERLSRAEALAARHPGPPPALAERDELVDEVVAASAAWSARPHPEVPEGRPLEELEAELASLPTAPEGDLRPHASVSDGLHALDLAEEALRTLGPRPTVDTATPAAPEERIRELARRLRTPQLPHAATLEAAADAARADLAAVGRDRLVPILSAAGGMLLFTAVLLAAGAVLPGLLAAAAAAALGGWTWRIDRGRRDAARRLARAEAALAPFRDAVAAAGEDHRAAEAEALALGLPVDPRQLDELADRARATIHQQAAAGEWQRRNTSATARRDTAVAALSAALREHGEMPGEDLRAAWQRYLKRCEERAAEASAAARRPLLEAELSARRAAEEGFAAARATASAAEERLRHVAQRAGVAADGTADEVAAALREWQAQRVEAIETGQQALGEWHQLQALLDGRSLDDLRRIAAEARARAKALGASRDPDGPTDRGSLDRQLVVLRAQLSAARREADALDGNLQARRDSLPDVAEAEEAAALARAELERVEELSRIIDATIRLLRAAEERVHRSLAPILAGAVARWLPAVCDGSYTEVSVDPASLAVRVKEAATGEWREARLLSEGTREQIYLLLRVAMAEHLVTTGEAAPLLLDEVTVQSDPDRKRRLLDVLHVLSGDRQVVLFTHDDDVVAWAEQRLTFSRDAIVRLPSPDRSPVGAVAGSGSGLPAIGAANLARVGAAD